MIEELKGQKAIPFLEWCYKIKEVHTKEDLNGNKKAMNYALFNIYEAMRFYFQPFSVNMLVNPIELIGTTKWQQAQERVLFEGWEKYKYASLTPQDYDRYDNKSLGLSILISYGFTFTKIIISQHKTFLERSIVLKKDFMLNNFIFPVK